MNADNALTKAQFELLSAFERAERLNLEPPKGDARELMALGYLENGAITEAGGRALEPYRVRRAVFIAAGFGSRMVPITLNTPKPLVRVHGKRIIDTLLDAVVEAEIPEIVIVRGYLGEQFDQLVKKYPNIRFVENPLYNEANNISSALRVRELLRGAYVFEADLVLSNPALVRKYEFETNFLGIPMRRSDDWCFQVEGGTIRALDIGGTDCYQEVGISYWSEADGAKLESDLKAAFEMPGGRELYWEQVPLKAYAEHYRVAVRPCSKEDIVEIDTFNELKAFDKTYDV